MKHNVVSRSVQWQNVFM